MYNYYLIPTSNPPHSLEPATSSPCPLRCRILRLLENWRCWFHDGMGLTPLALSISTAQVNNKDKCWAPKSAPGSDTMSRGRTAVLRWAALLIIVSPCSNFFFFFFPRPWCGFSSLSDRPLQRTLFYRTINCLQSQYPKIKPPLDPHSQHRSFPNTSPPSTLIVTQLVRAFHPNPSRSLCA